MLNLIDYVCVHIYIHIFFWEGADGKVVEVGGVGGSERLMSASLSVNQRVAPAAPAAFPFFFQLKCSLYRTRTYRTLRGNEALDRGSVYLGGH